MKTSVLFLVVNERNGGLLAILRQRGLSQLPLTAYLSTPQLPQRSSIASLLTDGVLLREMLQHCVYLPLRPQVVPVDVNIRR
jgi:hypothetical protein